MRAGLPCTKCGGSMFVREDLGGDRELVCLNCGRTVPLETKQPTRVARRRTA